MTPIGHFPEAGYTDRPRLLSIAERLWTQAIQAGGEGGREGSGCRRAGTRERRTPRRMTASPAIAQGEIV